MKLLCCFLKTGEEGEETNELQCQAHPSLNTCTCVRNTCAINALLQKDRRRQESQLRRSSGTQNVTGPTRSRSFCVPCVGGTTPDSSEWNPILTSSSSLPGTGGPGGVEAPAVPVRSYLFCHHQPAVSSSPAVQSRIRAQALGDHHYQNYQHTSLRHLQQTGAAQLGQNSSSPAGSAFHAHATYQNIFYGSRAQQNSNNSNNEDESAAAAATYSALPNSFAGHFGVRNHGAHFPPVAAHSAGAGSSTVNHLNVLGHSISSSFIFPNHTNSSPSRFIDFGAFSVPHTSRFLPFESLSPMIFTQREYVHFLIPDQQTIIKSCFYWGKMDRHEAEDLLSGKPEGTFLLRDSVQDDFTFSISFRRYCRTLHARIEQHKHYFSLDSHDPNVYQSRTINGLLEHYKFPESSLFFEPLLTIPQTRKQPFSLKALARAAVCDFVGYEEITFLEIPYQLKDYLREYNYKQLVSTRRVDRHLLPPIGGPLNRSNITGGSLSHAAGVLAPPSAGDASGLHPIFSLQPASISMITNNSVTCSHHFGAAGPGVPGFSRLGRPITMRPFCFNPLNAGGPRLNLGFSAHSGRPSSRFRSAEFSGGGGAAGTAIETLGISHSGVPSRYPHLMSSNSGSSLYQQHSSINSVN